MPTPFTKGRTHLDTLERDAHHLTHSGAATQRLPDAHTLTKRQTPSARSGVKSPHTPASLHSSAKRPSRPKSAARAVTQKVPRSKLVEEVKHNTLAYNYAAPESEQKLSSPGRELPVARLFTSRVYDNSGAHISAHTNMPHISNTGGGIGGAQDSNAWNNAFYLSTTLEEG